MDTAKRASSLNIGIMDEAMRSFGAQLPELDMHFPEEKKSIKRWLFMGKSMKTILTIATVNYVLFAGMKTVSMSCQKMVQKQPRFFRWHTN